MRSLREGRQLIGGRGAIRSAWRYALRTAVVMGQERGFSLWQRDGCVGWRWLDGSRCGVESMVSGGGRFGRGRVIEFAANDQEMTAYSTVAISTGHA